LPEVSNEATGWSKRSKIAVGALVVWVAVLVFGWALQPIDDTVPVVVDPASELAVELAKNPSATPDDAPRAQLVECNSLVDATARDTSQPLPELRADYMYDRVPCKAPHAGARLAALANALVVIALVAGWIWIEKRNSHAPVRSAAPDAART
jgi:hypothetical protein